MSFSDASRQPGLVVLVNGAPLTGAIQAEIRSTNHYGADRYSVELALGADPLFGAAYWASSQDILLDVGMSLDGGATHASLIQGNVDQADIDAIRGVVRLEGRDLTALLIEAPTQETFSNRTSSEIATLLAQRHGLAADVTPTATLVGRYYAQEHDSITLGQFSRTTTEWDLLVFLARQEQFDLFVRGTTLSFNPPIQVGSPAAVVTPSALIDLRLERSLTLARDIQVTVKSWNARQQRAFTQTARSTNDAQPGAGGGPVSSFVYVVPNLTTDQAIRLAAQRLAELTRHCQVISMMMPGELSLSPRDVVLLQGTGTEFDRAYYVDSIDRSLSTGGGFTQHVRATSLAPGSGATPPADIVASVTG